MFINFINFINFRKDATTGYPDIQELVACRRQPGMSNRNSTYFTQSLMLKITLSINPQTDNAGKDLNKCVFELARESGQREHQSWISLSNDEWEDIVEEKYKLHATIPSSSNNSQFQVLKRQIIGHNFSCLFRKVYENCTYYKLMFKNKFDVNI